MGEARGEPRAPSRAPDDPPPSTSRRHGDRGRFVFGARTRTVGTVVVLVAMVPVVLLPVYWHPHRLTLRWPCFAISLSMLPAAALTVVAYLRADLPGERRFWMWWCRGLGALLVTESLFGLGVDPTTGHVPVYVTVGVVATVLAWNGSLISSLREVADRATVQADVLTGLVGTVALWACTSLLLAELAPRRGAPAAWVLGAAIATTPGTVFLDSRVYRVSSPAKQRSQRLARVFALALFAYLTLAVVGVAADWPAFEPLTAPLVAVAVAGLTLLPLRHEYSTPAATLGSGLEGQRRHPGFLVTPVIAVVLLAVWVAQLPHPGHLLAPLVAYVLAMCALLAAQGVIASGESEALRHELHHLATHDELTGLWNRRQGELLLADALDRLTGDRAQGMAVAVVDLDGFKDVNDRQGHAAGDRRLQQVAGALNGAVRRGDVVCRFGGDEFVVLCGDVLDEVDAVAAAQRLVDAVRQVGPIDRGTGLGPVVAASAASAGVVYVEDWLPPSVALAAADEALLRAKRAGRDRVALGQVPARPRA